MKQRPNDEVLTVAAALAKANYVAAGIEYVQPSVQGLGALCSGRREVFIVQRAQYPRRVIVMVASVAAFVEPGRTFAGVAAGRPR